MSNDFRTQTMWFVQQQVRVQVPDGVAAGDRIAFTVNDDDQSFEIVVPGSY